MSQSPPPVAPGVLSHSSIRLLEAGGNMGTGHRGLSSIQYEGQGCFLWGQGVSWMIPEGTKEARARAGLLLQERGLPLWGSSGVLVGRTNWGQDVMGESQTPSPEGSLAVSSQPCPNPGGNAVAPVSILLGASTGTASPRSHCHGFFFFSISLNPCIRELSSFLR